MASDDDPDSKTEEPTKDVKETIEETKTPPPPEATKDQKKERKQKDDTDQPQRETSYVAYLKEYHTSRASWKFNKTQQTKLISNLY